MCRSGDLSKVNGSKIESDGQLVDTWTNNVGDGADTAFFNVQ